MANYNESSIKVLKGLEAVRKRPGMYIGSTDSKGLHHLVWEIFDNAVDEVLAGHAKHIEITLHADGSVEIKDDGRGIPTGMHPETGLSAADTAFTVLHAGGKFDDSAYKSAGGLHGVGASVVNALSSWMVLTVYREGKIWQAKYVNGGTIDSGLTPIANTNRTGTTVHFMPDATIFSSSAFNANAIRERVREASFLMPSLSIRLIDKKNKTDETFQAKDGLVEFVRFLNDGKKVVCAPAYFQGKEAGIEVEVAFQYTNDTTDLVVSFANSVKTIEGGTHVTGYKSALTRGINDYARETQILKNKDPLEGEDINEGMAAIVSVKVPERMIQYEGQTKNKLFTPEARLAVEKVVSSKLGYWLVENKRDALAIVDRALKAKEAREAARKARDEVRKLRGVKKERILSGKLTPAQSKDPRYTELFLVEGDSAGGSAKSGRDRRTQAILPLRGKVINVEKARLADLVTNEEIATIISAIGAGLGNDFNLADSNYGKIVIMTDADTDGAHIQCLLLTFLYRFMRPLIENGKVFVAMPPLYKVAKESGGKITVQYAWDEHDLQQAKDKMGKVDIQRYKGLGEMNADQLWETTMDPMSRQLIRVDINDAVLAERRITTLMGDNVDSRKTWINENVSFEMNA